MAQAMLIIYTLRDYISMCKYATYLKKMIINEKKIIIIQIIKMWNKYRKPWGGVGQSFKWVFGLEGVV